VGLDGWGSELLRFTRKCSGSVASTFQDRNILSEAAAVHHLSLVRILDPINGGRFHIPSGQIRVSNWINGRDMRTVSIGALIGQAPVIPTRKKQSIVNHRIDLSTFNEIYEIILSKYVQYLFC